VQSSEVFTLFKAACLCCSSGRDGFSLSLCFEGSSFCFLRGTLLDKAFHFDSNTQATTAEGKQQNHQLEILKSKFLKGTNIKK